MKFAVVVFACVLACASAQFKNGQYVPENQKYNNGFFNKYNKDQYNPFSRNQNNAYKPFSSSSPYPNIYVSSTPVPVTVSPYRAFAYSTTARPVVPAVAPVVPVVPSFAARVAAPAPSAAAVATAAPVVPVETPVAPVVAKSVFVSAVPPVAPASYKAYATAQVSPVAPVPVLPVGKYYSGDAQSAQILKYSNDVNANGAFNYLYETDNGIAAQAQGIPRVVEDLSPVVFQGSYSYTGPEGVPVSITYTADENGFHPVGDSIPTPPPIPAAILRSLEYISRNPPQEVFSAKKF